MSRPTTTRRVFLKGASAAALGTLVGSKGVFGKQSDSLTADEMVRAARSSETARNTLLLMPEALFRPTGAGCTVHWIPRGDVQARVLAGPEARALKLVQELTSDYPTEVEIAGFQRGRDLYLQCQFRRPGQHDWQVRPTRRIHTARLAGASFRVALIADSHVYFAREYPQMMRNLNQTNAQVLADRPDFGIFLGDEAGVLFRRDPPGFMTQERALLRWENWRRAFGSLMASVPTYLLLGNHEGEAGYFQAFGRGRQVAYYQRWSTVARKQYCLNPLPDTYPEGGESEKWIGEPGSPATGGADEGNCAPLQNYFAWSWGDALFVVLDVHRYTNIGGKKPDAVEQWTLGPSQMRWLEQVLTGSSARWKFVVAHHLVGGYAWNPGGTSKNTHYVYGRGGARYARVGEQARITQLMKSTGAQFFLYGHDHVFAHQQAEGIHFVCCGRPTYLQPQWWSTPGWREAYGDVAARNPHDFYAAIGYTRLTISSDHVLIEYVRTGTDSERAENVSQAEGEVVYARSVT